MNEVVLLKDQTLAEAVRLQIPWKQFIKMANILDGIPFDCHDIELENWLKYRQSIPFYGAKNWRARIEAQYGQIEAAYHAGFRKIAVVYDHWANECPEKKIAAIVAFAKERNLETSVEIRNASRLHIEELLAVFSLFSALPVETIAYCDTESRMDPFIANAILEKLRKHTDCTLEFHARNQYGLATANSLAAIQAGVKRVTVAVGGAGEAGHAAYEELIMAVNKLIQPVFPQIPSLAAVCHRILACIDVEEPLTKAIIGADIFAHESGIHVAGVLKQPELYEAFSPEEVGLSRRLVIGKHSGKTSLAAKLKHANIAMDESQSEFFLAQVRQMAIRQKSPLTEAQLTKLYQECVLRRAGGF